MRGCRVRAATLQRRPPDRLARGLAAATAFAATWMRRILPWEYRWLAEERPGFDLPDVFFAAADDTRSSISSNLSARLIAGDGIFVGRTLRSVGIVPSARHEICQVEHELVSRQREPPQQGPRAGRVRIDPAPICHELVGALTTTAECLLILPVDPRHRPTTVGSPSVHFHPPIS